MTDYKFVIGDKRCDESKTIHGWRVESFSVKKSVV